LLARHLDVRIQAKGTATLSSPVQQILGHRRGFDRARYGGLHRAERAGFGGAQSQAATEPANGEATSRGLAHTVRELARWDVTLKALRVESEASPL